MKTILIVEDDVRIKEMVRTFLELNKFSVVAASNGKDGIEIAKRMLPDLILSDVIMPEMDGFQMKSELSRDNITSTIPFIFMTSLAEREKFRMAMELGADDYITKPVILEELKKAIHIQLEKRDKLLKKYIKESEKEGRKKIAAGSHILLKDKGVPKFVKTNSIVSISADRKYTSVILENGSNIISALSLKNWEKMIPEKTFVRIHRSTIINIDFIEKIEKWFNGGYVLKLRGIAETHEISRRFYSKLRSSYSGD